MRFRPAIFIAFVFASFVFKFYSNGGNQKLKAWSFQLRKNYFCMLNIIDYLFFDTPCIVSVGRTLPN